MANNKIQKTNAARLLDQMKIKYELVPYEFDPEDLAAEHVAEELGEPIEQVFKTLVLRGDKTGLFVCVVAGNREVDLKLAAKASGNKKAEMLPLKELLPNTGYIRGGCTSIGMKKHYPTYFSEEMQQFDTVYVSAGQRGLQLKISPLDLAKAAQATFVKITVDSES
ncbi:MAG: Cys-tRNA(Pro) deacylase [Muribaculaceae bacterium]|nr:Cys-tRNA(Pro) deacylase [Muribaculaceae bacterium]